MKIYYNKSDSIVSFPEEADIDGPNELKEIVSNYNHTMAEFSDSDKYKGHRRRENFVKSNCLYGDIDNTHSEDEKEWMTISNFKLMFHNYEFYIVTSKSHQIEKNGKPPRDKFHVYFPIKEIEEPHILEMWLKKLTTKYPFFDGQVKDSSRFFAKSPNCKVYYNKGQSILPHLYDVQFEQKKESELLPINQITTGNRDDQFYRYACSLRNGGSSEDEIRTFLYNINNNILDEKLEEHEIEKCIKSASKYETQVPAKTLPKNKIIKNYYEKQIQTTGKGGAVTTFTKEYPYLEYTQDMEEGKEPWGSFIDGSGKRFLFLKDDPSYFIQNSAEFYNNMQENGYTLDFKANTNITENKYMLWIRDSMKPYRRFSLLPEMRDDGQTIYMTENIKPENNGWFRKSLDLITLETEKDRYRFAAGLLSAFLDGNYDGQKPLFAVLAKSKSSGKSMAIRKMIKIIQGEYNLEFEGKDRDEQQVSGIKSLANKYVLYDNLQYTRREQMLKITKDVTDEIIPAWFMNISHSRVRNNKTYFATFNDENAFNDDILNRIVTIRMKNAYDIDDDKRLNISKSLDVIEKNREKVLADILYHIQNIDELKKEYTFKAPIKFGKWAEKISSLLSTFFDEQHFDFGLSGDDKELSFESTMMKEFLEELMIDVTKDVKFITNDQMFEKYKEYFKQQQVTKKSVSKHVLNYSKNIDDYEVDKTVKKIQGKTIRGFEIKKI